MKNKTIALILIFLISVSVLISGCTDNKIIEHEIVKQEHIEPIVSSSETVALTSEYDYNNHSFAKATQDQCEGLHELVKGPNYPALENINIEFNHPDMELIGSYFIDSRTDEENDLKWGIDIIVQNNGEDTVWISNSLGGLYKNKEHASIHTIIAGGDKFVYFISGGYIKYSDEYPEYQYLPNINLNTLLNDDITFTVTAYDTIMPKVTPEYGRSYLLQTITNSNQMFDLESVKYVYDIPQRQFIVVKVNNPTSNELSGCVRIDGLDAGSRYNVSEYDRRTFTLKPGESETLAIHLGEYAAKDVRGVALSQV